MEDEEKEKAEAEVEEEKTDLIDRWKAYIHDAKIPAQLMLAVQVKFIMVFF